MIENENLCAACGAKNSFSIVESSEPVTLKDETFEVPVLTKVCSQCRTEFIHESADSGIFAARKMYRSKHRMVTPEELKRWRDGLGLSQGDLASILKWGTATISRYENGKLAELSHDSAVRMAMTSPEHLLNLVRASRGLDDSIRSKLIERLEHQVSASIVQTAFMQEAHAAPGFEISFTKIANLVAAFCDGAGEFETKLNKLFFYADFVSFRDHAAPITGIAYQRLPHGPVPSNYRLLYTLLEKQNWVWIDEVDIGEFSGTKIRATKKWDKNVLSDAEISVVIAVKNEFKNYSSRKISDVSHDEDAWKQTSTGNLIDFRFASTLRAI